MNSVVNFKEYRTKFGLYEGAHVPLEEPMIEAPELNKPCAKALSLVGNHSAFAFAAPGQFPASAIPSIDLNIEKLIMPLAKA